MVLDGRRKSIALFIALGARLISVILLLYVGWFLLDWRLAELSGRKKSNLSRTLKTMERHGFVHLSRGARGSVIPRVPYQRISLTLPLSTPRREGAEAA